MNGSYSLTQAGVHSPPLVLRSLSSVLINACVVWCARRIEYSIRFSKDAKEYAKQQKLKKDAQIHQIQEYVKELVLV
jgi:hypothetical protein